MAWQDRGPLEIGSKTQQAQQPKNFWTDQISTGGGIAGSLGGAATGAAIGSIVPGIGTVIGGLIGGIAGGALGSGGGELAENAITGEKDLFKNVGQEALLGGVFSAPPIRLARGVGALAKSGTAAGKASGIGARKAFEDAYIGIAKQSTGKGTGSLATSTVQEAGRMSTGGKLTDMGNRALMSQYGTIGKPFARSTDPKETISTLANAGIIKPADAERVASTITGGNGIITGAVSKSVGNAGGVDTSTLRQVFDDGLANYGLVEKDAASIKQVFNAQMNRLGGGAKGSISSKANPDETMSVIRDLEKRIANLTGKGDNYRMSTPERADQASVLRLVRDELEDQLYAGAGANKQLTGVLTPELRENLVALMPNNAKWTGYVDNNIMGAKTIGDLRSSVAPFVRIGKIIDEGDLNAMTYGGRVGNAFSGGGVKSAVGEVLTNVVKDPAARLSGTLLRATGGKLQGAAGGSPIPPGIGGAFKPTSQVVNNASGQYVRPSALYSALGQNSQGTNLGDEQPSLDQALMQQSGLPEGYTSAFGLEQPQQQEQAPQEQSPYPRENLLYDIQRDPNNADKYIAYYQQLQEVFAPPAGTELGATAKTQLASSGNASSTLSQLEGLFASAGGGSGKVGGTVGNLLAGAGLNSNAQIYNELSNSSVTQIARALNGGGQVTDADAVVVIQALPKITDSPEVAQAKFNALKQRLAIAQENIYKYNAGSPDQTDLASTLLAQQGGGF
jgi:hypothetical protein